ncbi:structural maintenance of chromosomes protein 5-like [Stegodyphus dumicola]|uniref:structural maintenance of chromosomes protein 5-like n=1 Tax=Stegodyphus dumicola TaxID=202533 RepID=UPI0015B2AE7F|nr:structural maintenance of chromosomes protein 5-like [Stegodyphus dumicola]
MSNLCQFLPQERVTEFSKMNKSLRLENMLQAIGEPHLFSLFNDLKKLRKSFCEMEEDIKKLENKKAAAQQKNERLLTEVSKQEQIKHLKSNLKMLQQHLVILEYSLIREEFTKLRLQRKEQVAVKNRILERENAVKEQENAVIIECEQLKTQINNMKKRAVSLQKEILATLKGLNECHEKVDSAKIEYRNKLAEKEEQKTILRDLETQIAGFQRVYDTEHEKVPEIESNIHHLTCEAIAVDSRIKSLQPEVAKGKVDVERQKYLYEKLLQRQNDMRNERHRKLRALRNMSKDTYEAVCWLEENRSLFKKPIFPPIFLEIKINDEDRKYIENHIKRRDLFAFICTDKEDNKTFTKLVRVEKKLNINIVLAPEESLSSFNTLELTSEHRKCGLQRMLKDLFTVPDAVMSFLCCCYNVHRIPVGTDICEDNLEKLISSFPTFFTPNVKISAVRSRYGARNVSVSKDQILGKNILQSSKGEDIEEHEKELKRSEQILIHLEQEYHKSEEELVSSVQEQDLKKQQIDELNKRLVSIRNLKQKLIIKQQQYDKKSSQIIDEEEEKKRVTEKVRHFNQAKLKYLKQLKLLFKESLVVQKDIIKVTLKLIKELKKHDTIKAELENIANNLRIANDEILRLSV